jgi:putative GTP pyrophosphokinase
MRLASLNELSAGDGPLAAVASRMVLILRSSLNGDLAPEQLRALTDAVHTLPLQDRMALVDDHRLGIGLDVARVIVVRLAPDYTAADVPRLTAFGLLSEVMWVTGAPQEIVNSLGATTADTNLPFLLDLGAAFSGGDSIPRDLEMLARLFARLSGDAGNWRTWLSGDGSNVPVLGELLYQLDMGIAPSLGAEPIVSSERLEFLAFFVAMLNPRVLIVVGSAATVDRREQLEPVLGKYLRLPPRLKTKPAADTGVTPPIERLTYDDRTVLLLPTDVLEDEWIARAAAHLQEALGDVDHLTGLADMEAAIEYPFAWHEVDPSWHFYTPPDPGSELELMSNSRVDRLGRRLQHGASRDDILELENLRHEIATLFAHVQREVNRCLTGLGLATDSDEHLPATARGTKTTRSIVRKLQRQSIRLSQLQDLAGMRIIVADVKIQDMVVDSLARPWVVPGWVVVRGVDDLRDAPHHGYRAVHVVWSARGRSFEIQVRTQLQHYWAEMVESWDRVAGTDAKHGGVSADDLAVLLRISETAARLEGLETDVDPRLLFPRIDESYRESVGQLKVDILDSLATLRARILLGPGEASTP